MRESPVKPDRGHRSPPSARETGETRSDLFFAAVEATQVPTLVTDPHRADNPIVFANHAFTDLTGYAIEEAVGRNCRFLQGAETDRRTLGEVARAIAERRTVTAEILNYRKDGSAFWNALYIAPVHDRRGELIYFCASQLDVSRRREAEAVVREARRAEALGPLTAGLTHDFGNLLQVISGYADILQVLVDGGSPDLGRLGRASEAIRTATDRAVTLTHQLMDATRSQRPGARAVSLAAVLDRLGETVDRLAGDGIAVRRLSADGLWNVRIDPFQAECVLHDILDNARAAMPSGGDITIETRNLVLRDRQAALLQGVSPGRYVETVIVDTGEGMPPEVLARATEPFFTTREGGRGLGLATAYGFARQSGGTVRIASEVARGTTVRLLLPAAGTPPRPEVHDGPEPGAGTILVVDDRPEVAETAGLILQDSGYRVVVSHGPAAAVARLEDDVPIDMLFAGLIASGGMTGVDLARTARARRPGIKVLLATGRGGDARQRPALDDGGFEIIDEPDRRTDLVRRVRLMLDGPADAG